MGSHHVSIASQGCFFSGITKAPIFCAELLPYGDRTDTKLPRPLLASSASCLYVLAGVFSSLLLNVFCMWRVCLWLCLCRCLCLWLCLCLCALCMLDVPFLRYEPATYENPILQTHVDTIVGACLKHHSPEFAAEFVEGMQWWSTYWLNDRPHSRRPANHTLHCKSKWDNTSRIQQKKFNPHFIYDYYYFQAVGFQS